MNQEYYKSDGIAKRFSKRIAQSSTQEFDLPEGYQPENTNTESTSAKKTPTLIELEKRIKEGVHSHPEETANLLYDMAERMYYTGRQQDFDMMLHYFGLGKFYKDKE